MSALLIGVDRPRLPIDYACAHIMRDCSSHDDTCARVSLLRSTPISSTSIVVDTVSFPAEALPAEQATARNREHDHFQHGSGVCVCYSGLLRGFGGSRSGALDNHVQHLLQPLEALFPGKVYVAFSTSHPVRGSPEDAVLPASVRATLLRARISVDRVVEELRPHVNSTSNYMQQLSFVGIAHCGALISRIASQRGQPFAFAVRLRYDLLLEPRFGGAALASWPIWASPPALAAAPILTLSKFVVENATSTRGLQLYGCPWQVTTVPCDRSRRSACPSLTPT